MEPTPQVIFPVGLTAAQLQCAKRALEHEIVRSAARARDERLGADTREAEREQHREMRYLLDRLRRLEPARGT